jgi:hypothetical protein
MDLLLDLGDLLLEGDLDIGDLERVRDLVLERLDLTE